MQFIDTHSHLIPYFDDGSPDWDTSLEMLRQGAEDGISEVVCTPHILSQKDFEREPEIEHLYQALIEKANQARIPMKIHLGSELYIQPDLEFDNRIATFANNGRYFLIEFPMILIPYFVTQRFFEVLMQDKIPVIAHPERNGNIIKNPVKAFEFVERGALLQVNAGSITGIFGKPVQDVAIQLLNANLVSLVGTDAHDLRSRPLKLSAAYQIVKDNWGVHKAKELFYENPKKIIAGQDISVINPMPPQKLNSKFSIKEKIKSLFS